MRFLIVEDDFGSRRLLQAILKEFGEIETVVDGEEAIDAFKLAWSEERPYDLILLDIMMPKLDGQQALQLIRSTEKEMGVSAKNEVKVIMTTALEDPANVIRAFNRGGATGYIVKPIQKEVLLDEIRKAGIELPG
ncbi:response regulator [Salinispira pacifica]|uniref:Response regulator n=1 Tax=Salinispira pacifica TaxID=1307761 RepID=V5WGE0_9SPIO|nr:response regulator [Salinispira pacifica]AHC14853.1 Response regulator [Salinispira pacifica]